MRTDLLRARAALTRAGFTLIELLAVILIIGILMTFLLPKIPEMMDATKVTACRANMLEIWKGLQLYDSKHGDLPKQGGAKFVAALIADGVLENDKSSAVRLTCPGVKPSALSGIADLEPTEWYSKLDQVTGDSTAYAGRDMKQHPLRKFPGSSKDALVADDNDPEMNHRTTTIVLFASGAIQSYEISDLRKAGTLSEDEERLIVGPDSPVEELQKLSLD